MKKERSMSEALADSVNNGKAYLKIEPYSEQAQVLQSIENWESFWDKKHTPQNDLRARLGFPTTTLEEILDRAKTNRRMGPWRSDSTRRFANPPKPMITEDYGG